MRTPCVSVPSARFRYRRAERHRSDHMRNTQTTRHALTGALLLALTACAAPQDPKDMGPMQGVAPAAVANPPGNTPFPCEVGAVLQQKCWGCHGSPTNYGAPMTLLRDEDVHGMTR